MATTDTPLANWEQMAIAQARRRVAERPALLAELARLQAAPRQAQEAP